MSDYLFVNPTFWRGAARVGDFWGILEEYNLSRTAAEADAMAMRSDWLAIGRDMTAALQTHRREDLHPAQLDLFGAGDD